MKQRDVKKQAQDALMYAMMAAFYRLSDEKAAPAVIDEAKRQVYRVEKLFGLEPGSTTC